MTYTQTSLATLRSKPGSLLQKLYSEFGLIKTELDALAAGDAATHNITRSATLVIAASDSSEKSKAQADYVCDGTADQVQLIEAMSELPANGGKIYLSEGTFNMSAPTTPLNNVHIQGSGMYQTIIKGAATLTDSVFKRASTTTPTGTSDNPIQGLVLSDFSIDGSLMRLDGVDGAPGGTWGGGKGTYFAYLKNCTFKNLYVHDTPASGLGNDYHYNCTYDNCIVINAGRGEPTGTGGSPEGHGFGIGIGKWEDESLVISNCFAKGCWFAGFAFESVDSVTYSKYMSFVNCISTENNYGFLLQSGTGKGVKKASIIGGSSYLNNFDGIHLALAPKDIIISDITIENNGQHGIQVSKPESENIVIHDCHINNNAKYGITTQCGNLNIHGNCVYLNGHTGIFVHADVANVANVNVYDNIVYNNGTAGVVGHNDGIRVHPSGYTITGVSVCGNRCFDNQVVKTQRYGIGITNETDVIIVSENDVSGNLLGGCLMTATGANKNISCNLGYITCGIGSATITTGQTTVDVTHGLAAAPTRVLLSPTTATAGKDFYVSAKGATTFTITIDSEAEADISFDWQAVI
jgi:hypothetical protein